MEHRQKQLSVIKTLYEQQKKMHKDKSYSVKDRILSISQPYVRLRVRGKVKSPTEFGTKINISLVNGYGFIENLCWDNYHEGSTFIQAVENYKRLRGCYPAVVSADAIYRNRDNLRFCKEKGIRLSGPKLSRPPKLIAASAKRLARQDSKKR